MKTRSVSIREVWPELSRADRQLATEIIGMLRAAKRCGAKDVARAAAEWERGISFFIKVRLIGDWERKRKRKARAASASPSIGRSQSGVSPSLN
jgi:hypothetical protein